MIYKSAQIQVLRTINQPMGLFLPTHAWFNNITVELGFFKFSEKFSLKKTSKILTTFIAYINGDFRKVLRRFLS